MNPSTIQPREPHPSRGLGQGPGLTGPWTTKARPGDSPSPKLGLFFLMTRVLGKGADLLLQLFYAKEG